MPQGIDTCLEFMEKVLDTARNLHRREGGKVLDVVQFEGAKAVMMEGLNTKAQEYMISANPQSTDAMINAARTATYLENTDREQNHIVAASGFEGYQRRHECN